MSSVGQHKHQHHYNYHGVNHIDPFGMWSAFQNISTAWMAKPERLIENIFEYYSLLTTINYNIWHRCASGACFKDPIEPNIYDERFQDAIWFDNPVSDLIKEYYLLISRWVVDLIENTHDVDLKSKQRALFWAKHFLDALAPTNFFWMNPRAVSRFIETGGKSAVRGLEMLLSDMIERDVTMVDVKPFKVGENLAMTNGKVIFRNELLELIQYSPTTEKVHAVPVVIVPPWINKFYILDLNKKMSFIQFIVSKGFTVFTISWRNVDSSMRETSFDDYLINGIYTAIEVARNVANVESVHTIGYCVGGTALTTLMAWLNSKQKEVKHNPIQHFTLLTTLLDFSDPGEIGVFIDEDCVDKIEEEMHRDGFLDGKKMALTFRMLRANSLIWHYVVHKYLLGEDPQPFDVLYWNMDSTRLPEKMHSYYLRQMYLHNNLAKKGSLCVKGTPIDLGKIVQAGYAVGTEQDHITPWKGTFKSMKLLGGNMRYVLATSGHIVGVLSPPVDPPKRRYWVGEIDKVNDTPDTWVERQAKVPGSWWDDWVKWMQDKCGDMVDPPHMGNSKYQPLCSAPGTYVLKK